MAGQKGQIELVVGEGIEVFLPMAGLFDAGKQGWEGGIKAGPLAWGNALPRRSTPAGLCSAPLSCALTCHHLIPSSKPGSLLPAGRSAPSTEARGSSALTSPSPFPHRTLCLPPPLQPRRLSGCRSSSPSWRRSWRASTAGCPTPSLWTRRRRRWWPRRGSRRRRWASSWRRLPTRLQSSARWREEPRCGAPTPLPPPLSIQYSDRCYL